jgi:hypothetical protein
MRHGKQGWCQPGDEEAARRAGIGGGGSGRGCSRRSVAESWLGRRRADDRGLMAPTSRAALEASGGAIARGPPARSRVRFAGPTG